MPKKGWPYYYPSGKKVPASVRAKFKRCIRKVKAKNKRIKSPHAICIVAIRGKRRKKKK